MVEHRTLVEIKDELEKAIVVCKDEELNKELVILIDTLRWVLGQQKQSPLEDITT